MQVVTPFGVHGHDEMGNVPEPKFHIPQGNPDFVPAELLGPHVLSALLGPDPHQVLLPGVQEVGIRGVVGQAKPDNGSDQEAEEALEDKDPSPPCIAAHAVHLQDEVGQQAAKGTGQGGANKEVGHALGLFLALVHHGHVQIQPGEQASLAGAENQARGVQAADVGDEAGEDGGQGPNDAQQGQEEAGGEFLHGDGPRSLEEDVGDVEDGDGGGELVGGGATITTSFITPWIAEKSERNSDWTTTASSTHCLA